MCIQFFDTPGIFYPNNLNLFIFFLISNIKVQLKDIEREKENK